MRAFCNLIRANLTRDLLKPGIRKGLTKNAPLSTGHCYVASEALFHLTGQVLKPKFLRIDRKTTHWWLEDHNGKVWDLTADQFNKPVPYQKGKKAAFLTKEPCHRTRTLLLRVLVGLQGMWSINSK